jgi:hypothetical protein
MSRVVAPDFHGGPGRGLPMFLCGTLDVFSDIGLGKMLTLSKGKQIIFVHKVLQLGNTVSAIYSPSCTKQTKYP